MSASNLLRRWAFLALIVALAAPANAGIPESKFSQLRNHQKIAYQRGSWEEFFGAAQAYRRYWFDKKPDADLVVLETLALMKLCHFDPAYRLIAALRGHFGASDPSLLERLHKLEAMIPGVEALKLSLSTKEDPKNRDLKIQRSSEVRWPTPRRLPVDISPLAFRAKVVSQCDR